MDSQFGWMMLGALAGVLLCILIFKKTKTDGRIRCQYDERQNMARGNGFKYGFFTALFGNILYGMLISTGELFPVEHGVGIMIIGLVSLAVYVIYCIWHDAYFALNEKRSQLIVIFLGIGVVNLVLGISNIMHGEAFTDGMLNIRSFNLFCGLLFLVIFAAMFLKHAVSGREGED